MFTETFKIIGDGHIRGYPKNFQQEIEYIFNILVNF